jgi:phosphinothricin acetyltransferase
MIRRATDADAEAIADIYNYYVTDTIVTFEEESVPGSEIARRIHLVESAGLPWVVAEENGEILGYAYATPWKDRIGYRFSVETTVYLSKECTGRGIGSALYDELFRLLEKAGVQSAVGGVALPNDASVALHEKFGMRKVAEFERIGVKFGQWINVGYWQRFFTPSDDSSTPPSPESRQQ